MSITFTTLQLAKYAECHTQFSFQMEALRDAWAIPHGVALTFGDTINRLIEMEGYATGEEEIAALFQDLEWQDGAVWSRLKGWTFNDFWLNGAIVNQVSSLILAMTTRGDSSKLSEMRKRRTMLVQLLSEKSW